jgi:mannosyl-3-phosphoglycerate phosphatase
LYQTSVVGYFAVDAFISPQGKVDPPFEEFAAALERTHTPLVWCTNRTRAQMDGPRRSVAHNEPFVAEGGCVVYLPEDYFHLRPTKTARFGRFTGIPIAEPQPAASQALETLAEEIGVEVVSIRSLSPRELSQNLNLSAREAELARLRDFDELFFFAGASEEDTRRFSALAKEQGRQLRPRGNFWSLAVGANLAKCVRELSKLYDRALRSHAVVTGIATTGEADDLFPACDRRILLEDQPLVEAEAPASTSGTKTKRFWAAAPDLWENLLQELTAKR